MTIKEKFCDKHNVCSTLFMSEWQLFKKRRLYKVLFLIGIFFALILWNPYQVFRPVRMVFGFIAIPFERVSSVVAFHVDSWVEFFGSVGDLKNTNDFLEHENIRLAAENVKLLDVQKENEILRNELQLIPRKTFKLESATVVGQDMKNFGNWILIDKGLSSGIQKGMTVIVDQGVFIGRIEEVLSDSSRVSLVTNPESMINGIDVKTEAKGIVKGQHGLGAMFDMVLQSDVLNVGDDIITSGLGGDVPRGLFLGKIESITSSDDRLFQRATIILPVNISRLRVVSVIVGNQ